MDEGEKGRKEKKKKGRECPFQLARLSKLLTSCEPTHPWIFFFSMGQITLPSMMDEWQSNCGCVHG